MRIVRTAFCSAAVFSLVSCSPSPLQFEDPVVFAYVTEALKFMEEQGYYVDEDWDDQVAHTLAATSTATTVSETYGSLALAARVAGGTHSIFIRPSTHAVPAEEPVLPSARQVTPTIGLLEVPAFNSPDVELSAVYADSANDAISRLAASASCGWIVDLYANGGGNLYPMLAAAGSFLPQDLTVLSFIDRDASRSDVSLSEHAAEVDGKPIVVVSRPFAPATGPIAILQSSTTASAAEALLIAFRGQANVRTFGTTTAGFPTGNVSHTLPDGAVLAITNAVEADRDGQIVSSALLPDVSAKTYASTKQAAIDWVSSRCGG